MRLIVASDGYGQGLAEAVVADLRERHPGLELDDRWGGGLAHAHAACQAVRLGGLVGWAAGAGWRQACPAR